MTESEWGPWIEHDGKGCPCRGAWVEVVTYSGDHYECRAGMSAIDGNGKFIPHRSDLPSRWIWNQVHREIRIILYRIRKPKGLAILTAILREVERTPELV